MPGESDTRGPKQSSTKTQPEKASALEKDYLDVLSEQATDEVDEGDYEDE